MNRAFFYIAATFVVIAFMFCTQTYWILSLQSRVESLELANRIELYQDINEFEKENQQ